MELKVYISGKVTGEPELQCKFKFDRIEQRIKKHGIRNVINPKNLGFTPSWTWEQCMVNCMNYLQNNANCIVMLSDWTDSDGAKIEYKYALEHDYLIIHEHELDDILTKAKAQYKWLDTSHYEFP